MSRNSRMRKPLTQLPIDFGGEEGKPSPPAEGTDPAGQQEGQYLAAPGVGIRVKAFKKPSAASAANGDLFPVSEPAPHLADAVPQPEPAAPIPALAPAPRFKPAEPRRDATAAGPRPATPATKPGLKAGPSKRGRKSLKQATAEADLIEIPADEVLFAKQYYTMGEVSEMFKVNQSLLRYWETEFDILQPRKNKKGDRYFRPVDIKNLHLIYHLLRHKKYTIEGAKDFLRNNKKAKERFEIIQRLQQIRSFLLEWKAQL